MMGEGDCGCGSGFADFPPIEIDPFPGNGDAVGLWGLEDITSLESNELRAEELPFSRFVAVFARKRGNLHHLG